MAGRGLNKVMLIGRLGKDPEMRFTQSGQAVANFTIATDESWKDKEGNMQERTEWHKIVAWGKLAEIINQYLSKGRQVYIDGRLQTRDWQDRDGNKRYTTEIVADQMIMLGGRGESAPSSDRGDGGGDSHNDDQGPPPEDSGQEDDIPF